MLRTKLIFSPLSALRAFAIFLIGALLPSHYAMAESAKLASRQDDSHLPTQVEAGKVTSQPDRALILEDQVEITRGATNIKSETATYSQTDNVVTAEGGVDMRRYGDRVTGERLRLNLDTGEGEMIRPTYKLGSNGAQGTGTQIIFEDQTHATIEDITYSTCEGSDPDWYLKASTLSLDNEEDTGVASGVLVYFKDVPILGFPALSFPISSARRSGVLTPTFGSTTRGGMEFALPYYFNIAPNYDLTLTPKVMAQRGLQVAAEGRYLGQTFSGITSIELLMNDKEANDQNRYSISSKHKQQLSSEWSFDWNFNQVSDDDYFSDFGYNLNSMTQYQVPSAQRLLLRDFNLRYESDGWRAQAKVSNYQLLQDTSSPIQRPYERLPQLSLSAWHQEVGGFDWTVDAEWTRFWLPTDDLDGRPNGDRLVIAPSVSYSILGAGYFVKPKVSFHASSYALDDYTGGPTSLSRTIPTVSLDAGLIFERNTSLFGKAMTQTLEPRLFYVYTPYRDQSDYPIFDTAEASFGFNQIFSENRFVGSDRISDANQLTAALVSRYIDSASGLERMKLAIGQRFYFEDQLVQLDSYTGDVEQSSSDLLLAASGRITPTLKADAAVQYSQSNGRVYKGTLSLQWKPEPMHVFNAEYRYLRDYDIDQINFSGQWPLANKWYGVGRVSYSLLDDRLIEGLLGAEYNAGCWVARFAARRLATSTKEANTAIFFQLQLNGLSKLGSNPLNVFADSVDGYQLITPKVNAVK